ncbi:hypothetical protein, partial [Streptomyces beihaiensis]
AVTAAVVLGGPGSGGASGAGGGRPDTAASGSPSVTTSSSATTSAPSPGEDASRVTDQLDGITMPVLAGWQKARYVTDDAVLITTPGTYDCPYDDGVCRRGTVAAQPVTSTDSTDPATLARKDVAVAAYRAYDTDVLGERPFGGITSHKVVSARQVAVAGRVGYLVRWRVRTAHGPGGYVESVVFRSGVGAEGLVVVRLTLDASRAAPPPTDLDRIVAGIWPMGATAGSGGVGSSIGPSD